jgi:hypothetical protein
MNRCRWLWLGAAVLLFCAVRAPRASADTFSFNGFSGAPAPGSTLAFKLQLFEVALDPSTPAVGTPGGLNGDPVHDAAIVAAHKESGGALSPGVQLYGVFNVTTINSMDGSKQYWTQSANQQLAGFFYGYTVKNVTAAGTASEVANFTGGSVQLLFNSAHTFSSATGPFAAGWSNVATSNGVIGSKFLDTTGVGGILPDAGAGADTSVTLQSTFTSFDPLRFTGVGDGFLAVNFSADIPVGANAFNPSTAGPIFPYPSNPDASFKSNFDSREPGTPGTGPGGSPTGLDFQNTTGWTVAGQDPLLLDVAPLAGSGVPEPASVALWGFVLLGGGLLYCRRNRRLARGA